MTFPSFSSRRFSILKAPYPDTIISADQATSIHAQPGMVQPEDIVNATAFLLSEEVRYITGVNLPVMIRWFVCPMQGKKMQ